MLQYSGVVALTSGYTTSPSQIWLDNVACDGFENRLVECRANSIGAHDCALTQVAGVRCQGIGLTCNDGDIRLEDGYNQGRIEICYNNVWGTVCDDSWGNVDAQVACKQLGFTIIGE